MMASLSLTFGILKRQLRLLSVNETTISILAKFNCTTASESVKKKTSKKYSHFIDSLRIHVKAGKGGQGLPNRGGAGGKGGDIIVVGARKPDMSLKDMVKTCPTKRYSSKTGVDSKFFCLYGENAASTIIQAPLGISIVSQDGHKIGEINKKEDKILIAKGGAGGCAENRFSAEQGQSHTVTLDLKLIADVGFLGFPNAGKSTLLKALSNANPKIASYPFTTVSPNIGIIEFKDFRKISLADLPGLIEGAHLNQGMGHNFLKHVERTKLLLFIVDIFGFQLGPMHPSRTALETIALLNKEVEMYQADLTEKPAILVLNKMDMPNSYPLIQKIRETLENDNSYRKFLDTLPLQQRPEYPMKFEQILPISAAKDTISVNNLKNAIRTQMDINEDYSQYVESKLANSVFYKA